MVRKRARLLTNYLFHEISHLSLPAIDESHTWPAEGVAVYVEGVARAQPVLLWIDLGI
jgi:hypothetical protein